MRQIAFARRLEAAGAAAIGVHARHVKERPSDAPHWDLLAPIVKAVKIPVLVNGSLFTREDIDQVSQLSGASSFLLARGALANASVFRKEGSLPYLEVRALSVAIIQSQVSTV